jgi:hypothetical protein|tara:strand:+ start:563 stop:973 length:411 start_codon:yes stop_codon:yes gene_type:complete
MDKEIIEKIYSDDLHIASIVRPELSDEGLTFLTEDENFIQVGIWNYKKDKRLDTHYHNTFPRESTKTNETVYVVKGTIKCNLYKETGEKVSSHTIESGEMIVQFNGAHEYFIIDDAVVIETKNGPYFGPDKDRTRI